MKIKEILQLIELRTICRIRGLETDVRVVPIKNKDYFRGAKEEMEVLLRHLDALKWIVADIDCATKYLEDDELKKFKYLRSKFEGGKK